MRGGQRGVGSCSGSEGVGERQEAPLEPVHPGQRGFLRLGEA